MLLVAATIDLGRIFYSQITITNAAREGAMEASRNPTSFQANAACNTTTNRIMCRVINESKGSFVARRAGGRERELLAVLHDRDGQHGDRHGRTVGSAC